MSSVAEKDTIRKRFARHLDGYEREASVQKTIAERLAGLAGRHIPAPPAVISEAGCGTGFLTRELLSFFSPADYYLNDIVPEAVRLAAEKPNGGNVRFHCRAGDAESVEFPCGTDLFAAGSVFQWFARPGEFLRKTAGNLSCGGYLLFNTFAPGNLREIRETTGMGLDYPSVGQLKAMLEPWFRAVEIREETIVQTFDAPTDVLQHLKKTGGNGNRLLPLDPCHAPGVRQGVPPAVRHGRRSAAHMGSDLHSR